MCQSGQFPFVLEPEDNGEAGLEEDALNAGEGDESFPQARGFAPKPPFSPFILIRNAGEC